MQLYEIDFELLDALDTHGRNVALNLTTHINADRGYLNQRLRTLHDHAFLTRIGPAERAGLYEINDPGRRLLSHRDQYDPTMTLTQLEHAVDTTIDPYHGRPPSVTTTTNDDGILTELAVTRPLETTTHRYEFGINPETRTAWLTAFEQGGETYSGHYEDIPPSVERALTTRGLELVER